MRYQLALAKVLRERANPEEEASQRQHWADLRAEEERRFTQELDGVVSQLSPEMRRFFDKQWSKSTPNDEQLRAAEVLLAAQSYPKAPLIEMVVGLLENDPKKRIEALQRLASRYNVGQSRDEARWGRAKRAWINAHKRGRPNRAIPDAMEAGGFGKSAVYQRSKEENWRAEVDS